MVKKTRRLKKQKGGMRGGMRTVARLLTPFAVAALAQGQTPTQTQTQTPTPYPTFVPGTVFRDQVTGRHYLYDPSQGLQEVLLVTPSALPTATAKGYSWPNFSSFGNTLVGATRKLRNSETMRQLGNVGSRVARTGADILESSKHLPGKAYELGGTLTSKGAEYGTSAYHRSKALASNLTGAVQSYLNPDGSVTVLPTPYENESQNENEYDFLTPGRYKFQTYDGEFTLGRGILGAQVKPNSRKVLVTNFVPSPNLAILPVEMFSNYFPETSEKRIRNALETGSPIPSITIHLMQNTPDKSIWLNNRG